MKENPTLLGVLDLHLFGEGRHEEIYKKLGAHVTKVGRNKGVSFAVWAPHAACVNVVGDFNGWNGRSHQMRKLGNSGVWELFIPKLTPGTLYKFEIFIDVGGVVRRDQAHLFGERKVEIEDTTVRAIASLVVDITVRANVSPGMCTVYLIELLIHSGPRRGRWMIVRNSFYSVLWSSGTI